jgi:hypothetical protein
VVFEYNRVKDIARKGLAWTPRSMIVHSSERKTYHPSTIAEQGRQKKFRLGIVYKGALGHIRNETKTSYHEEIPLMKLIFNLQKKMRKLLMRT